MKNTNALLVVFAVAILSTFSAYSEAKVLFFDGFESGDRSHVQNGFAWVATTSAVTVSSDIAHSGTHSLRFEFAGVPPGSDSWAEQRFQFGQHLSEVWLKWYQYFPDGNEGIGPKWVQRTGEGAQSNNKFLRVWGGDYGKGPQKYGLSFEYASKPGDSKIAPEYLKTFDGGAVGTGPYGLNWTGDVINDSNRGKWLEFVVHIKADDGSGDGVIEVSLGGTQIISDHSIDIQLQNASDPSINFLSGGYLMGWANTGFDQNTYTYIDDFEISDTPFSNPPMPPNLNMK